MNSNEIQKDKIKSTLIKIESLQKEYEVTLQQYQEAGQNYITSIQTSKTNYLGSLNVLNLAKEKNQYDRSCIFSCSFFTSFDLMLYEEGVCVEYIISPVCELITLMNLSVLLLI